MHQLARFSPPKGFKNPHLQTLLPRVLFRQRPWSGDWQTFELSDGDFVELCWYQKPDNNSTRQPILLLFHGLEGSVESPYIWQTMQLAAKQGWLTLVMHFRGCGQQPINRLPRAYHSGDTGDASEVIQYLACNYSDSPLLVAGFSLGGNMLSQLLTTHSATAVKAATICCAPFNLHACSERIDNGFSRFYRRYLLTPLKQKVTKKISLGIIPQRHPIANLDIKSMTSFFQFDDQVTAPLHGFSNVDDYYQKASGKQFLPEIKTPTLIIHASDDPFMSEAVIPSSKELPASVRYELSARGGHIGFIERHKGQWQSWLPPRLIQFFKEQLQ
ncbi:hydrolase [Idiomarina seosinensis]|uniref:Hydrolase n=1 Tax=Idiomarina seosinensis TaxID=281739 RepID=A0A432ZDE7_9GAMM|nr:hydrolase [Idiomarina seosinensis]RUO75993.1 hydrolase [Idiomarina seosinensis]